MNVYMRQTLHSLSLSKIKREKIKEIDKMNFLE